MTVAGVIVLLVNDHLLKQAWPGFVTGKLSDVAGLVVAPAMLALLFRRRADLTATVLTGVLFTAVKTTETGAEAASYAWTLVAGPSRVLADPTDLLALPALALAWWVRRSTLDRPSSARWRIIVTTPLAVLAVAATGAAAPPPSAEIVEVEGSRVHVHTSLDGRLTSEDGGRTWTQATDGPTDGPADERDERGQSAQCVPGQATRCYQVLKDRLGVEQSDDGGTTWRPAWVPSGDELQRLSRQYDVPSGLRSRSLAVVPQEGGHHVVVANGLAGIVVRDTSGAWRRVGWPGAGSPQVNLEPEWRLALFLAICMMFAGAGAGLRRYGLAYTCSALAGCLGALLLVGAGSLQDAAFAAGVPIGFPSLLLTVSGAVACVVLAGVGQARLTPVAIGMLAAPLVFGAVYLPFTWWAEGTPDSYGVAVALAALLTGLVVLASAAAVRSDARRANSGDQEPRPTGT
ncbi:hypothetical protein FXF51_59215 [Nonomuraea sp. PA05]|uniref:hypothetical protein n=1 Tax=Nonomuraea sp. PA05 TaxID=2604466 RepID=UPI0011D80979|nr:hypothetical protein [Nonomuraea sp. PA05]TYB47077.1 hypothetical protein FXF51_59215 [Nonomuraea sp. PA05]